MNADPEIVRCALVATGTIQGVGMRPFVFRIARRLGLTGNVRNTMLGVEIEVQGSPASVDEFTAQLRHEPPPGARIDELRMVPIETRAAEGEFEILSSIAEGARRLAISPDLATCADCFAEIDRRSTSRRAGYAFTSCSHCGPRYSISEHLPYDRESTTMRLFVMCENCGTEYSDPADRRFHAQPIACPRCGPELRLLDPAGDAIATGSLAISQAAREVATGNVVAVKGIGGYQLIADATNSVAVAKLRERKRRPDQPFAVMVPDAATAQSCCLISVEEMRILTSPAAPIVLLRRRAMAEVASNVAPANARLGVMLPYSPLHRLLLDECEGPVVCTSGNLSNEPICIDDRDALARLAGIADFFLVHNRALARPLDDSVARASEGRVEILRRARGYTPGPIKIASDGPITLALGTHQKNAIGLAIGADVTLSQHLGDLSSAEARSVYLRTIDDLLRLHGVAPELLACDLHPDYASTAVAEDLASRLAIPLIRVQHHHAHIAACLAEHCVDGPALGFAWDGTGWGTDGTVWGGEALVNEGGRYTRIAHLRTFPLIGGEAAIRDPRRAAVGLLLESGRTDWQEIASLWFKPRELRTFRAMAENRFNTPRTSSIGRLFEAIAALAKVCEQPTFDGQAALRLESMLDEAADRAGAYHMPLVRSDAMIILDWAPMLEALLADLRERAPVFMISARFHNGLIEAACEIAARANLERIALGGGCFQNQYLMHRISTRLSDAGRCVYRPYQVPVNDGGVALGQIAVARKEW